MTALIVTACIVLVIALIAVTPVRLCLAYKEELRVKVRYGLIFYTLMPKNEAKEKKKEEKKKLKEQKKKQKAEANGEAEKEKAEEKKPKEKITPQNLSEKIDKAMSFAVPAIEPLGRLTRGIRLTETEVEIITVGDDAAEAAIQAGRLYGVVYSAYAMLKNLIGTVKKPKVTIKPDYYAEEGEVSFKADISIRPYVVIAVLAKYGVNYFKYNNLSKPAKQN